MAGRPTDGRARLARDRAGRAETPRCQPGHLCARQRAAPADRRRSQADPFFTAFACTREEEALGINAGAWMAGTARHPADADLRFRDAAERASRRCRCRSRSRR